MNHRLLGLTIVLAGSAAVIGSKIQLDRVAAAHAALPTVSPGPLLIAQEIPEYPAASSSNAITAPVAAPPVEPNDDCTPVAVESFADLAAKDPYSAALKAEALPSGYARTTALNQVATAWAKSDPNAALAWARQLFDPEERNTVTSSALFEWGQANPTNAIACAEIFDLGAQTCSTMGILAQKFAASDLPAAVIYVSQQPDGDLKNEMLSRVSLVMSEQYPDLAGKMICEKMSAGPAQTEAAISVVHQWALKDPEAAMAWAETFPVGDLRTRALNEITGLADYQISH